MSWNKTLEEMHLMNSASQIATAILSKVIQPDGTLKHCTTEDIARRSVRIAKLIHEEACRATAP